MDPHSPHGPLAPPGSARGTGEEPRSPGAPSSAAGSAPSDVEPPARVYPPPVVLPVATRIRHDALDPDAVSVVMRLQRMGHEAYLVGGCVRDLLLGLEPKDFDVATDASPNRIKRLFRSAFVIGRRFRLVHVRFDSGHVVEAATFRKDPGESGMHPEREDGQIFSDNVFGTAPEDANRRDFTVNALFYDPVRDVVVDHVGGLRDLEARVIRSIGDPARRMTEDPVRMIRAVHFAARMGGTVEPSLLQSIRAGASLIANSSPSRLYVELIKVLTRGCARPTLRGLYDLGVLHPWLPEVTRFLDRPIEWPQDPGGTHEAARRGEPEDTPAPHLTWNLLGAADAWGMAARGVPESLAMATLVGPWLLDTWAHGPRKGHDLLAHVEESFRPLALKMSIPRRVSYELRDILWMLDRLRRPPEQKARLRSIVLRASFPETLAYFGLEVRARDGDLAAVDRWREIADEVWQGEEKRRRARDGRAPDAFLAREDEPAVEGAPLVDERAPAPGEAEGDFPRDHSGEGDREREGGRRRQRGRRGGRSRRRDDVPSTGLGAGAEAPGATAAEYEGAEPAPHKPAPYEPPRAQVAPPPAPAPAAVPRPPARPATPPPAPPAPSRPPARDVPFGAGLA